MCAVPDEGVELVGDAGGEGEDGGQHGDVGARREEHHGGRHRVEVDADGYRVVVRAVLALPAQEGSESGLRQYCCAFAKPFVTSD